VDGDSDRSRRGGRGILCDLTMHSALMWHDARCGRHFRGWGNALVYRTTQMRRNM
jgi:hypothetical protein